MEFALLGFALARVPPLLPSFLLFLLECGCLSYDCPIIVFLKHITCIVSQVHSWRGILPQDKLYLKAHSYFT